MANYPAKIQKIIDTGYEFRMGDYISDGFNLVQKNIGGFIAWTLLYIVMAAVMNFIPLVGPLAFTVISPALSIGPLYVAHQVKNGAPNNFNDFFRGFDKFGELFLTGLLTGFIVIAAAIPGYAVLFSAFMSNADIFDSGMTDPEDVMAMMTEFWGSGLGLLGMLLVLVPVVYLAVSFTFAPALVWFYDMKAWDAMMASRKLVGKNFWWIALFMLVTGFLSGMGFVLICIGILFTIPAGLCMQYAAFADVTQLDKEDTGADIMDHFAPIQ